MRNVCPQCQGVFDAQFLCPNCGVTLQEGGASAPSYAEHSGESAVLGVNLAQRCLAGVLLSQGSYFALRNVSSAVAQLIGSNDLLADGPGRIAAQIVCVLAGAIVAGAGSATYLRAGLAVGFVNFVMFIGSQFAAGVRPETWVMAATGVCAIAVGAAGAFAGSRYWPSLETFVPVVKRKSEAKTKQKNLPKEPPIPIAWARVLGGAVLSIGCTVWAGPIRDFIVHNSQGAFGADSRIQLQFTAWMISALAMLIGGAFAGASSRGGIRHGFLVGLLASAGVFIIHLQIVKEVLPAQRFFSMVVGLPDPDAPTPGLTILFLLTNTLLLGVLGGYLGAKLLPRLAGPAGRLDRGAI